MARDVARSLLPRFGGASVAELPGLPLSDAPSQLRLALVPARPGILVLEGPAGRRFHVYLSCSSRGRDAPLRRVLLPLSADDPVFRLALNLPTLRGALDANGRAEVPLDVGKLAGAQLGSEGLLAAATLLRADTPADADDGLWAEEVSNRVTVVGPDGQPSK
jgi:hypothetical protein